MLKDGWLNRQVESTIQQINEWPSWMKRESRFIAESTPTEGPQSPEGRVQPEPPPSSEKSSEQE